MEVERQRLAAESAPPGCWAYLTRKLHTAPAPLFWIVNTVIHLLVLEDIAKLREVAHH